jgi:parvulin-like peptidyl-prolyl isomerase
MMASRFRRAVLAPLGGLLLCLGCSTSAPAAVLADLSIRYVNDEVITWGDIMLRNQMRQEIQRGRVLAPSNREELLSFSRASLDELTDESLLYQKAADLKLQADHQDIVLEVMEIAKRNGQGLTLREQALHRRQLERTRTSERLVMFFDGMAAQATPTELRALYDLGGSRWDRPARAQALQIVLRPTGNEERAQLRTAKSALLRRAQDARSPLLAGRVQARLALFLEAAAKDQESVLDALVQDLSSPIDDLLPADQGLVAEAKALKARMANVMDRDEALRRLDALRMSMVGLQGDALLKAFRTAGAISQAPVDPGWVEPGTLAPEWDQAAATAPLGEVTRPFIAQGMAVILLPTARDQARRRTFEEVSGELERLLRYQRRDLVRKQQVAIQRAKASIKDLQDLSELITR